MTIFAEQLKKIRVAKGLSQEDLAQELFISRQSISKWENGDATPDLDNLIQLAEYLKVSLDELVLGKPEEVRIERVVEKSERPMNVWEFLDKNSEMSKRDFLFILVFFILFFGGVAVVHYFSK